MKYRVIIAVFTVILSVFPLFAAEEEVTVRLHFAITEATVSSPPEIIDNHLVLTYKGNRNYRFVGAAFRHEDFKQIHPFYVNTNGVYILTYSLPKDLEEVEYRLVVDGLWMTDPTNPVVQKDFGGVYFSRYQLPQKEKLLVSPDVAGEQVTFTYRGAPGQMVYVYGDFNNWDPFMYRLNEIGSNGVYSTRLRITNGKYKYKFIVDGTAMADPLNGSKAIDIFGELVSMLTVEGLY